jgi:hypothetical protein
MNRLSTHYMPMDFIKYVLPRLHAVCVCVWVGMGVWGEFASLARQGVGLDVDHQ